MKKIITVFIFLTNTLIYAQHSGITYQAVIYNPSTEILPGNNNTNAILANREVCLRFSIVDYASNLEYQETQKVKTDDFGMVNLIVGLGNQVAGSATNFNAIVWNSDTKKMKVEIDVKGNCSDFIEISDQDFSAVPFAYAAKVAETVSGIVPISNGGTGSNTVSGAKVNLGLNNVDNTSDANKPISTATQTALNGKEDSSNKSTVTTLGTSNVLYPTQNAVKVYVDNQIATATISDATTIMKGKLQLAGDLGGTAEAPTVPGLANKENTITIGTTSQYWRGDKTWQNLNKSAVGLGNVDNTSDANKPISSATQIALNGKEESSNKSNSITLGTSDVLYPTQNAVKTYVDNQVSSGVADATTTVKGKLQLAGDLGGTADAPTVPGLVNKENTITAGTTSQFWRGDKTWQTLNKSVVGLGNIDNTADVDKPVSSATQAALNDKENTANKSTTTTLGTSDVLFPTQNAVKVYVDTQINANATPEATTTVKGKLQLAGDLAGTGSTASSPIISNNAISTNKIADTAVTPAKLEPGTNDSVLVTDNVGNVVWLDRDAFGAVADMSTIEGVGTTANPFKVKDLGISTAKLANNSVTTAKLTDSSVSNAKIGEVISIEKGGTGANMNSTAGYIKQATTGANFSTVSSIPVTDVTGAVRSVNGVFPSNNGNVSVLIGQVTTGTNSDPTQVVTSPHNSDIYVISGQTGTPNDNGRTFINDGTNWHEIATNVAALENTFVKLSGSTMTGNLVFPSGNNITIADAPTGSTDVANKGYVDTKIKGSGTINFIPKYSGTTNPTNTLTNSSIFDDGTNVGIGTSTPANKLEISHGTAGNSGLRFTNLNATSMATTTSNKVLGLNNNGDVILTNIPGTQNIVDFSVNANPNTAGTTFVPNTPSDQSIVYQSTIDNSLWTYNGTSYITYTAPASTAWNLMSTTNDAGSNKTSNIWRSGGIITGGSSTSKGYGNLTAIGGSNFTGLPVYGTASVGLINNSTAGWSGSGFLFSNSTTGSNAFSMVYNNDKAYFGQLTPANGVVSLGNWGTIGLSIGSGTDAKNKLDVFGGTTIGSYAGVNTAPTNGLIVSGNVGIGATTPATKLQVNSSTATNTINTEGIFTMQRPQNPGVKWENIAQFSLGSYSTSSNASSRLDLSLNDGAGVTTSNVMTWLGNGYVGVGTTSPISLFSNAPSGTNFVASNSAIQSTTGISWLTNTAGYNTSLYNSNNVVGSNGLQVKVANNSNQTFALEVGQNTTQTGISTPLFNVLGNGYIGVGTNAPISAFSNTSTSIQGSNSTNAFSGGLTWSTPGTGFAGSFYSQPTNGNGLQVKIAGNTSANNALEVSSGATQTGSLTPLFNVLGNGNVGVGTSTPTATFELATSNGLSSVIRRFGNTNLAAANLILQKTYGTTATSHGAGIINGDYVGRILFSASNGSSYLTNGTDIVGYAAGVQSATNNGGGIFFRTVPQNSVSQSVERMRIDENGNIGIGTSAPTAQLHTTGSVLFSGAGTPGAGKVLTSDALGNATWQNAVGSTSVTNKTANFTLTTSDNAGFIVVNSASLVTVTVPSTLPAGFYCQIIQQGAGQVQVVGSGVTMNSALGFFSRAQGSSIGIMMATSTTGFVSGDTGL